MLKSYYVFILFLGFAFFLNAQTVYYSSSPVPPNGIKTPKGSTVTSGGSDENRTEQVRKGNDTYVKNSYPGVELIYTVSPDDASSLSTYNCHGYAWIYTDYKISSQKLLRTLSSGSSQYADIYMSDGSYMEVTHRIPGAKVFTHGHSAVITNDLCSA